MPMLREQPINVSLREALRQEALGQEGHGMGLSRKLSEESIRTELCEGPVSDSPPPGPRTPERDDVAATCSDRAELIERLKRGESPTWVPSRHLESLFQKTAPRSPTRSPRPRSSGSTTLLPPVTITPEKITTETGDGEAEERLQNGLDIERPRSALHSGDFRGNESSRDTLPAREPARRDVTSRDRSGSHSWLATSPPRAFALDFERRQPVSRRCDGLASTASSLASSLSQSFAYMPPTSPLVQSESNDDPVDLALPMNNIDIATATSASHTSNPSRRHTMHFYPSSPYSHAALSRHLTPSRENSHPYQAHQPRRSLTSTPNFHLPGLASSPQTPGHGFLGTRRQSISSDASPMLHASMVGSYEESILRGRMSTTPSRPLDFQAEIGVLGLGKCKPSLKCPAHVTVPFSAVFYNYNTATSTTTTQGRTTVSEDGPSPYVGQIDLENGLSNPEDEQRSKRKMQTRYPDRTYLNPDDDDIHMDSSNLADTSEPEAVHKPNRHRRSRSPKAPPGGSYRVPEKGMLQIIIKNQNKTAVKLFLVRYDLAGMEPGTKTFVRQRSYSDPEDDLPLSSSPSRTTPHRPILRYLIQLHICCLARGRFYLYKSIRVVFANRVPDGKEKLRNEVTYPEPRFSPYKPTRVMLPSPFSSPLPQSSGGGPGAIGVLAAEKASRRRSAHGFSFAPGAGIGGAAGRQQRLDALDGVGLGLAAPGSSPAGSPLSTLPIGRSSGSGKGNNNTVDPLPLSLPQSHVHKVTSNATSETSDGTRGSQMLVLSDSRRGDDEGYTGGATSPAAAPVQRLLAGDETTGFDKYDKLSKGEAGYGGITAAASAATEGLLARSLRSLGVGRADENDLA